MNVVTGLQTCRSLPSLKTPTRNNAPVVLHVISAFSRIAQSFSKGEALWLNELFLTRWYYISGHNETVVWENLSSEALRTEFSRLFSKGPAITKPSKHPHNASLFVPSDYIITRSSSIRDVIFLFWLVWVDRSQRVYFVSRTDVITTVDSMTANSICFASIDSTSSVNLQCKFHAIAYLRQETCKFELICVLWYRHRCSNIIKNFQFFKKMDYT